MHVSQARRKRARVHIAFPMDMMDTEIVIQLFITFCCNNIKLKHI